MNAPAASTIVARNYLPQAKVLADSYRRHHGDAPFVVLVVDAVEGELDDVDGVHFLSPADLDLDPDDFSRMATSYTATELCTAVKPWLLRRLLEEHDVAIYLDPDIEVFAPFADEIGEAARSDGIVLTPHVLEPIPRDGFRPSEGDIMLSGVFNLGFIAVSSQTDPFLRAWSTRMRQDAIVSPSEQLFFDQRWIDNVPALFRHRVIADPGFNVAYWNVYQRPLERSTAGTVIAGGVPLRFMHYSGYRPEKPWLISMHYADKPRVVLSENPLLAELVSSYRDKLIDAGYPQTIDTVPYRWATLPDGTPISTSLRRAFREAWLAAERRGDLPPRGPFGPGGAAEFLAWATTPSTLQEERAGLNPWAMSVWRERQDVRDAFPHPLDSSAADFRVWCATSGVAEGELPVGALPERDRPRPVEIRRSLGVNLLGYLTTESGVGELGRLVQETIESSGIPVAIAVEESTVINRTGRALPDHVTASDPHFGVSVVCVNADMTDITLRLHPEIKRDRYVIGVWGWEISEFARSMFGAFDQVDEIWTYSDFCVDAISAHSPVPVHRFPIPVRDPLRTTPTWRPDGGPVRFLFVFDHNSVFERKNPLAAVAAFQQAFDRRDDVRLTIKSINGDRHPSDRERLRIAAAGDDRIELIEHYLDHDEVDKLFATSDCYLSLHRSEGFGLTVAEAMAHGLAVIATDYSATAEFLTPEVGWPIPYRLVPVGHGSPPYPHTAEWAEPDIDAAVAALREVADDPRAARLRGEVARDRILRTRSLADAAQWVRHRIERAYDTWFHDSARGPATGPLANVRHARDAIHLRPDVGAPSRVPGARAFRRAVLRALDHHDNHQRSVMGNVIDAFEGSIAEIVDRLDRIEEHVAKTTSQLAAANAERIDTIDRKLVDSLHGRDVRMDHAETAIRDLEAELHRRLPALQQGLLRLHDVLTPVPSRPAETVETAVGMLRLPADDTVMLPWLREYGSWEEHERRVIDVLLPDGGTFVDVGAHVGYFTVHALHRVGVNGTVVAVEPWPEVRELLEHNVAANVAGQIARTLTILPAAAWDAETTLRMEPSPEANSGDTRVSATGSVEVEALRLDSAPCLAGRRIDVVKCDAQGSDHKALAGMTGLFEVHRPHILCEFDPGAIADLGDDPAAVLRMYRSWDYVPVVVTEAVVEAIESGDSGLLGTKAALGDQELIDAAGDTPERFVTLWLRPASAARD